MEGLGMITGIIGFAIGSAIVYFAEGTSSSYQGTGIPLFGPIKVTTTTERSIGCLKGCLIPIGCGLIGLFIGSLFE